LKTSEAGDSDVEEEFLIAASNSINPIDQLDTLAHGERKAMTEYQQLQSLQQLQTKLMLDDAASNAMLRSKYRETRNAQKRRRKEASRLGLGRGIELPDDCDSDRKILKALYDPCHGVAVSSKREKDARDRERTTFANVRSESIFSNSRRSSKNRKIPTAPPVSLKKETSEGQSPDDRRLCSENKSDCYPHKVATKVKIEPVPRAEVSDHSSAVKECAVIESFSLNDLAQYSSDDECINKLAS